MKINIVSDLHLEFETVVEEELCSTDSDVLVLAGDIGAKQCQVDWVLHQARTRPVIYIPGNHEYYHGAYPYTLLKLRNQFKNTNVHLLDNDSVIVEGVRFLGTTLWTDFKLTKNPKHSGQVAEYMLNDYRQVRVSPSWRKLRAADTLKLHELSVAWLSQTLTTNGNYNKTVVVTHHAPLPKSIDSKYVCDDLQPAYVSDLSSLIKSNRIDLWCHGHIHASSDYTVDETRVICNPRGYPMGNHRNLNFNPDLTVNV